MNDGSNDGKKPRESHPELREEMERTAEMQENKIAKIETQTRSVNMHKKSYRCTSGNVGPPPRPFKKARYAWEIKNYEHTVENMSRNGTYLTGDLHEDSQESQSSEGNSDISQEEIPNLTCQQQVGLKHHTLLELQHQQLQQQQQQLQQHQQQQLQQQQLQQHQNQQPTSILPPPIMPVPYPAPYAGLIGPNSPHLPLSNTEGDGHPPLIAPPRDADERFFRWHTRQICRSIFDNTVNRMLENMGFSPVTEQNQGIHPLLVLNLSDEEDREAEEAQHRVLETEALTAAMHQKGLLVPPYNYEQLESGTTTDYDSSEEDSELGEEGIVTDDLSSPDHMTANPHHNLNRPILRFPQPSEGSPIMASPCEQLISHDNHSEPASLSHTEMSSDDERVSPHHIDEEEEDEEEEDDVDGEEAEDLDRDDKVCVIVKCASPKKVEVEIEKEIENKSINEESNLEKEKTDSPKIQTDDNENCIGIIKDDDSLSNADSHDSVSVKENVEQNNESIKENLKHHNDTIKTRQPENNNDKFFLDQAIQMAIKQQGLGYQHA